jgi:hypothetical protein
MTRKKMADDMGLPESTLRGWQSQHWTQGQHYIIVGRTTLIDEGYFESLDDLKFSTLKNFRNIWHQRWRPVFGTLTAEHITTQMIRKQLSTWEVSPKTKKNCLSFLSSVLDFADCTPQPLHPDKIQAQTENRNRPLFARRMEPIRVSAIGRKFAVFFNYEGNGNATRGGARIRMERLRRRKIISQQTGRALPTGRLDQNIGASICGGRPLAAPHVRQLPDSVCGRPDTGQHHRHSAL